MAEHEHIAPLDAAFVEIEQLWDHAHMHIGAALLFDPLPGEGGAPALAALREHVARRLPLLPRFSQRLSAPRTGGLGWPVWEDDERFDLDAHVRHASLPAPGGEQELHDWLADFWSHRLDRARPLWEMVLVDGLEGGRWALATKTHHAVVDGVGSLDIGHAILDVTPDGDAGADAPVPVEATAHADPHEHRFGIPGWLPPALLVRGARAGAGAVLHPGRVRDWAEKAYATMDAVVRAEILTAPRTSINVPVSGTRGYDALVLELDEVKAVKRALGGTVNDVMLAIAAGGLRRLLLERGEPLPDRPLRAQVPVNLRGDAEHGGTLGNKVTSYFADLPVAIADPGPRHAAIVRQMARTKQGLGHEGIDTIIGATDAAPPVLHAALVKSLFTPGSFNLTITNVPGPQFPLYAFGSRLRTVLPLVPLFAEHTVGLAIVSYDGRLTIGVNTDRTAAPDAGVLMAGLRTSFAELRDLARRAERAAGDGALSSA
jgi:diacylglycerol O-acyltransferase / wax synthase